MGLTGPKTAVRGNWIAAIGMGIAVVATLIKVRDTAAVNWILIVAGLALGVILGVPPAKKTKMTAMPQLVPFTASPPFLIHEGTPFGHGA